MPRTEVFTEEKHDFDRAPGGQPAPGVMWVFWRGGQPEAIEFFCPCGCGRCEFLYLTRTDRPRSDSGLRPIWDYSPGPSISPSIWFKSGCCAHFNIIGGKVSWS